MGMIRVPSALVDSGTSEPKELHRERFPSYVPRDRGDLRILHDRQGHRTVEDQAPVSAADARRVLDDARGRASTEMDKQRDIARTEALVSIAESLETLASAVDHFDHRAIRVRTRTDD